MGKRVQVGFITGAHGIKGQVTVHSLIDPAVLITIENFSDESGHTSYNVRFSGNKKKQLIATVAGVTDRNAAEALKKHYLYIDADDAALPAESRLIGMNAQTQNGTPYGVISAVYNFGAGEVVEIERTDGSQEMLPLQADFVIIKNNIAIITPPEYVEIEEE